MWSLIIWPTQSTSKNMDSCNLTIHHLTKSNTEKITNNLDTLTNDYTSLDTVLSNRFGNTYLTNRVGGNYRYNKDKLNWMIGLNF
jgi:hypothetical protein